MQHLDTERVAAFDQEPPSADELVHLAMCSVCRAERDAYDAIARLAAREATDEPLRARSIEDASLTEWESLSAMLRKEGLLTSASDQRIPNAPLVVRALDGSGVGAGVDTVTVIGASVASVDGARAEKSPPRRYAQTPSRRLPGWIRFAAAMGLVAGGVVVGRWSVQPTTNSVIAESTAVPASRVMVDAVQPASLDEDIRFASVSQATAALNRAQGEYERASMWLAGHDTTVSASDVYRARLAALDQMMAASRAALRDAPQDPVLNRYFMAASTARAATLQQLSGALPVDKTIEGY